MLAFGVGVLAIAAVLHRRRWLAVLLVAAAAAVHVTTGLWFAISSASALVVLEPALAAPAPLPVRGGRRCGRRVGAAGRTAARRLTTMDAVWLQAVATKDSLFAIEWPLWAWASNLGLLGVLWAAHRRRRAAAGRAAPRSARSSGAPPRSSRCSWSRCRSWPPRVALAGAAADLARVLAGRLRRHASYLRRRAGRHAPWPARLGRAVRWPSCLIALATGRGAYIMSSSIPTRRCSRSTCRRRRGRTRCAGWRAQPLDAHVLADPGHAWKYGTSVRVSAPSATSSSRRSRTRRSRSTRATSPCGSSSARRASATSPR